MDKLVYLAKEIRGIACPNHFLSRLKPFWESWLFALCVSFCSTSGVAKTQIYIAPLPLSQEEALSVQTPLQEFIRAALANVDSGQNVLQWIFAVPAAGAAFKNLTPFMIHVSEAQTYGALVGGTPPKTETDRERERETLFSFQYAALKALERGHPVLLGGVLKDPQDTAVKVFSSAEYPGAEKTIFGRLIGGIYKTFKNKTTLKTPSKQIFLREWQNFQASAFTALAEGWGVSPVAGLLQDHMRGHILFFSLSSENPDTYRRSLVQLTAQLEEEVERIHSGALGFIGVSPNAPQSQDAMAEPL